MLKNIFVKKKFWSKKNFREKKFGQTKFLVKEILVKKVFTHKIILFKKIFWLKKKFGPRCFEFCQKKLGRVNPGAGIYDPPPQKIVGLKLCGIVVSCLKRKFLFQ